MSEPYWVPFGGGGGAGVVGIGTSLPASPNDGDEYVLTDSLTAPTYAWRFKYVAGITDAYKWVCVGGSPMSGEVAAVGALPGPQASLYQDLTSGGAGPSLVLPRAGIYVIDHGFGHVAGGGANHAAMMSYDIGATAAVDADRAYSAATGTTQPVAGSVTRSRVKTFATALTLAAKYRTANTGSVENRWMKATPVRVS